jgi:microcystin-dependent protein
MTDPSHPDPAGAADEAVAALTDLPIGTIAPYTGDCGNAGVIGSLGRKGWMPCDGSMLLIDEYPELYDVIRLNYGGEYSAGLPVKYSLPDLTGQFIRGVNLTAINPSTGKSVDPDTDSRVASNVNGNTGNKVGSMQLPTTGAPGTPFATEVAGSHRHKAHHLTSTNHRALDGASFWQARDTGDTSTTASGGEHIHKVNLGGDAETRPTSVSMFYIIKAY